MIVTNIIMCECAYVKKTIGKQSHAISWHAISAEPLVSSYIDHVCASMNYFYSATYTLHVRCKVDLVALPTVVAAL